MRMVFASQAVPAARLYLLESVLTWSFIAVMQTRCLEMQRSARMELMGSAGRANANLVREDSLVPSQEARNVHRVQQEHIAVLIVPTSQMRKCVK